MIPTKLESLFSNLGEHRNIVSRTFEKIIQKVRENIKPTSSIHILNWNIINECDLTNEQSILLYDLLIQYNFRLKDCKISIDGHDINKLPRNGNKKRILECESDMKLQPDRKKRKLLSILQLYSFSDMRDCEQFLCFSDCMARSQLFQTLKIPEIITKTIAEYSTGNIRKCANSQCCNEFITLHSDWMKAVGPTVGHESVDFGYLKYGKYYYCNNNCVDCSSQCDVDLVVLYFCIPVCEKCERNLCENCKQSCSGCYCVLCQDCDCIECDGCGIQVCDNCKQSCIWCGSVLCEFCHNCCIECSEAAHSDCGGVCGQCGEYFCSEHLGYKIGCNVKCGSTQSVCRECSGHWENRVLEH